ncbi:DUF4065 domain-containing protein [Leuconostoc suionicum]|uniref:Panacea domain-containing protein n=1 Tax=Leuconostoc suionicum TaxID=1511761 RepID=UPI0019B5FDBD|nr:type II toxin-antitoxin system antitoxin SocA domain-containing protein [Leuconostoc suionicum]MBC9702886.1 DUF4065 domain-containing protein [Leuconostoc sp.]MDI6497760.1 DUF4065 domain-containing protein [Leuconostoc suionicum]MDI6499832.1 DUF4065 domain-containing protein [Leuconostoc suionicum]MDI6502019.1 DUF4065 domain-containing protein [Leuconostoc suionicum]MDI6613905.1 DUF4065 domain-containing protein [Leuconostoc suionicum]
MTKIDTTSRNYNVMDIANFIVDSLNKKNTPISNLLLQKVLYYVYVDFLATKQIKLFNDPIEKWPYGPVIREVYYSFKSNGSSPILSTETVTIDESEKKETDIELFGMYFRSFDSKRFEDEANDSDLKEIREVSEKLAQDYNNSPFKLVDITHEEPMWKNHKIEIENRTWTLPYNDGELIKYFRGSTHRPWQKQ